jgi:hypothetical protein
VKRTAAFLALLVCACAPAGAEDTTGWMPVSVTSTPAPISQTAGNGAHYGGLVFRGGVELKSTNRLFGGWSGIEIDSGGRFTAVSDAGAFFRGRITLNEAGDLTGVSDTEIAILRDENGQPIDGKPMQDAEDITRLPDGRYAVNFEGRHRIEIFDLDGKGPIAGSVAGPPVPQDMSGNEGMEALTLTADGDLLAGREFAANLKSPTQFFRLKLDGSSRVIGPAQVDSNYGLVSMRRLSDGDFLALERFYLPLIGSRTIVRRYRGAGLDAKKPHLSGPVIAKLQKPLALNNFEGLGVVEKPGAPPRLYIIVDNNFNPNNPTLLYAFDLVR